LTEFSAVAVAGLAAGIWVWLAAPGAPADLPVMPVAGEEAVYSTPSPLAVEQVSALLLAEYWEHR
jgi:hypothetical protein